MSQSLQSHPPAIFDSLFLQFMEAVSDDQIPFQEYKSKWDEAKRLSLSALSEATNTVKSPSFLIPKAAEDVIMVSLGQFIRQVKEKGGQENDAMTEGGSHRLEDYKDHYKNCVLLHISSKSPILLFLSLAYFKTLIDNPQDHALDELIKKLEFFKYQVSRNKQARLLEVFKALKSRIEASFPINAFHSLLEQVIRDKLVREAVIDLVQEIIVDLILNCNFHHIIQNRNIELKRFILQLRNSRSEPELLSPELKTLISRCFLLNFTISYLQSPDMSLKKEAFIARPPSFREAQGQNPDLWGQRTMDFLVAGDGGLSYLVMRGVDYEKYFMERGKDSGLVNKENFERKMSINTSFNASFIREEYSMLESWKRKEKTETVVSGLTVRKMKSLVASMLGENAKTLEKAAGFM